MPSGYIDTFVVDDGSGPRVVVIAKSTPTFVIEAIVRSFLSRFPIKSLPCVVSTSTIASRGPTIVVVVSTGVVGVVAAWLLSRTHFCEYDFDEVCRMFFRASKRVGRCGVDWVYLW